MAFGFGKSSALKPTDRSLVLAKVCEIVDKSAVTPDPRTAIAEALQACGHKGHGPDSQLVTGFIKDLDDYAVPRGSGKNIHEWWSAAEKSALLSGIKEASKCIA